MATTFPYATVRSLTALGIFHPARHPYIRPLWARGRSRLSTTRVSLSTEKERKHPQEHGGNNSSSSLQVIQYPASSDVETSLEIQSTASSYVPRSLWPRGWPRGRRRLITTASVPIITEKERRKHLQDGGNNSSPSLQVIQYPASSEVETPLERKSNGDKYPTASSSPANCVTVFFMSASRVSSSTTNNEWKKIPQNIDLVRHFSLADKFHQRILRHFLPSHYPTSVAPGYAQFSLAAFFASVAGSAGMVLSTQCLLLAVGVVGTTQNASIMAGALNWVIKDGMVRNTRLLNPI
jgi:hypothetical protein